MSERLLISLRAMVVAAGLTVAPLGHSVAHASSDSGTLGVHPISGLFGPEESVCGSSGRTDNLISRFLCDRLGPIERRQYWGHRFSTLLGERFTKARIVADVGTPPPTGMTRETMMSRTLVASLHVSRADIWTVRKPSVVEVNMPITLTLLMTNVLTGETMFAHTVTNNVQGLMDPANYQAEAVRQFDQQFDAALVRLIDETSARFQPSAVTAQVRGRSGELFIIDAGLQKGLREGDQIGADARVEFADTHYALVKPALDQLAVGQTLSRYIAQPVDALNKPSLLVVIADTHEGFPHSYASTIAEEALSAAGGFSLVQINPAVASIRGPLLNASRVESRPPALPDYFLRVTIAPLDPIQSATNVTGVERRVQDARVFMEVVSHDGRVVYAVEGADQQIDNITNGMAPSTEQRRDVAVRNAMLRAAQALRTGFTPSRTRLQVASSSDSEVVISDPTGALGMGQDAHAVRSIGRVSGIQGDVWVPVAALEVVDFGNGVATARQSGVEIRRVRRGDQIAHNTIGSLSASRYRYTPCLTATGAPNVVFRGIEQPLFSAISFNRFAAGFSGAVHPAEFAHEAAYLGLSSIAPAYRDLPALSPVRSDICFDAAHSLAAQGQREAGRNFVQDTYELTVAYQLKRNGERVGLQTMKQSLTATAVPSAASPDYRNRSLQIDLATFASALALGTARTLNPTQ
ncbi:hypothetical protein [uncultured Brevundimonas sp.]|uniref:hypothetical protein n=1 Tax=uncultured Brevundimonas sp. TaxID=213418 RepID=UPI0026152F49|nr:hypothetical protein [uncultured Brevundimonas sp.]